VALTIDCRTSPDQSEVAIYTRQQWLQIVAFMMMFVGISDITEANLDETYRRMHLWESTGGPLAGDIHGPVTEATLRYFIGAHANVSTMTKRQFTARFKCYAADVATRKAKAA
jgi:hypothetical protein